MKKLMMTLAAGLSVTALLAVNSENIVGYSTTSLPTGFKMLAVNWELIGNGDAIDIQGLDNPLFNPAEIETGAGGDQLLVYDTANQKFVAYSMYPIASSPAWDAQWTVIGEGELTPLSLTRGEGFLFKSASAKSLVVNGQVDTDATESSFNFVANFNAFGNQFPVDFDFNSEIVANVETGASGDQLLLFDTPAQKFVAYSMYPDTGTSPTWDGQWTKIGEGELLPAGTVQIAMGEGALYKRAAAGVGTPVVFSRGF